MDLSAIPILDHHCHSLRLPAHQPTDGDSFRRFFVETNDPDMAPHVRRSIFYLRVVRDLAALLGCEADEDTILAARAAMPFEAYARQLFDAAHFSALFVDTGLSPHATYSVETLATMIGRPVETVIRLEYLMEQLIASANNLGQVEEQLRVAVRAARSQGIIGLKSIAAYRGGLHVAQRTNAEAAAAFPALKEITRRYGRLRLEQREMLDYLLRAALEEAAAAELPVQFHVAFGDDDADLRNSNPLQLRALLTDPTFRKVPFVLLHCYPYVREAGYLAALYANVYIDVSLTVPLTAHGCAAAFSEALELAPISKLLFATDAHSIPELFYVGALHGRHGLGQTLDRLVADQIISSAQAEEAAEDILWRNSMALYEHRT